MQPHAKHNYSKLFILSCFLHSWASSLEGPSNSRFLIHSVIQLGDVHRFLVKQRHFPPNGFYFLLWPRRFPSHHFSVWEFDCRFGQGPSLVTTSSFHMSSLSVHWYWRGFLTWRFNIIEAIEFALLCRSSVCNLRQQIVAHIHVDATVYSLQVGVAHLQIGLWYIGTLHHLRFAHINSWAHYQTLGVELLQHLVHFTSTVLDEHCIISDA